jgi:tetratricopeptide (TPR) repeat protein
MPAPDSTRESTPRIATAPEISGLINLIEGGDIDRARAAARTLDGFVPATEPQWQQFHNLFEKLDLRGQDEIMTLAFLDIMPNSPHARLNYALLLLGRHGRERLPAAQAQIDLLLPHLDPAPDFLNKVAGCLWRLGNWPKLIDLAQTGLRLHPRNYRLQFNLAVALFRLRRLGPATEAFASALEYANKNIAVDLEILGFADRNAAREIGNLALDRALSLAINKNSESDWQKLLQYLTDKFDQARVDHVCGVAAAQITDTGILALLFDFAEAQAAPAIAIAIGRRLQAAKPERRDIIEKLAALERRGKSPIPSETWWRILKD